MDATLRSRLGTYDLIPGHKVLLSGTQIAAKQGHKETKSLTDPATTAKVLRRACRPLLESPRDADVEDRQVPLIERIVTESPNDPAWGNAVLEQLPPSHVAACQETRCSWECRRELEFVARVMAGEASLSGYLFYKEAQRLIRRELSLVPAKPENVLFIGSGPLPLTGVLIHEMTGAHVTCIDCDRKAIAHSHRLLLKLGLHRAVCVSCGYGEEIQAHCYDLIVIALLAKPKAAILANVWRTMRPTATSCVGLRRV